MAKAVTEADLVALRAPFDAQGLELFAIGHVPPHRYRKALLGLPGRDDLVIVDRNCHVVVAGAQQNDRRLFRQVPGRFLTHQLRQWPQHDGTDRRNVDHALGE